MSFATVEGSGSPFGREARINFPVGACFAAALQQSLAGVCNAPAPVQSQQAEGKISAADVRPVTMMGQWGISQTTLVTGPLPGSRKRNTAGGQHGRVRSGRGNQAECFQGGSCCGAVQCCFHNADNRKVRRVFTFEIDAARDTRGSGSARIGVAALAQPSGKIGRAFPYCQPSLMIAGTGSKQ